MRLDIFLHVAGDPFATITSKLEAIMATQAELAASLRDLTAQVGKVRTEVLSAVARLQAAVEAAGATSPEVDAALQDLRSAVQGLDDLNEDEQPAE